MVHARDVARLTRHLLEADSSQGRLFFSGRRSISCSGLLRTQIHIFWKGEVQETPCSADFWKRMFQGFGDPFTLSKEMGIDTPQS